MRRMKTPVLVLLVVACLTLSSTLAYASTNLSITGGSMSGPTTSALTMSAISGINLATTQTSTGNETLDISDDRGTGAGWRVSVAATNLTATVSDPSAASQTLSLSIPASGVLTAAVSALSSVYGQDTTGITQTTAATAVTDSGIQLLSAGTGYGMGHYSSTVGFIFTMPKTIDISYITASDQVNSRFKSGSTVSPGIFAGTYTSTVTYTTANTP